MLIGIPPFLVPIFDGGTYMKRGGEKTGKKSGKRVELWIGGGEA
jgi:hypothetical protein